SGARRRPSSWRIDVPGRNVVSATFLARGAEMNESKYVRAALDGEALIITPLFTYATFTEPGIAAEWEAVQGRIDAPETHHVIVDLGEIPYFGSTVLEWMSQIWKRINAKGGHMAAIRPSPIGREVLLVARLDK